MAFNLYVMPVVTVDRGVKGLERQPKYLSTFAGSGGYGYMDYGNEQRCIISLVDVAPAVDTALRANADVLAIPQNLDQAIGSGGALTSARNGLEAVNIPGTWLQASTTWREAIRFVGACCQFAQQFQAVAGDLLWFTGGVGLTSTFSSLPLAARNGLIAAAAAFNFDTSAVTGSTTLRAILLSVGQQYLATQPPLTIGKVTL